jgi:hypothetical protein
MTKRKQNDEIEALRRDPYLHGGSALATPTVAPIPQDALSALSA